MKYTKLGKTGIEISTLDNFDLCWEQPAGVSVLRCQAGAARINMLVVNSRHQIGDKNETHIS